MAPQAIQRPQQDLLLFRLRGDRTRQLSTGQGTAASAAMRNGDFSELLPKTIIRDPFTKDPFPGNIIPPGRVAPQAVKLMQYIPLPNRPGPALNYIQTGSVVNNESQYFGRVDEKISDKDTLFFRIALRDAYSRNVTINP